MPDLSDLCVIFDLDGTLVDSAPDLSDAMNAVLAGEGLAPLPDAEVRHLVGEGARALIVKGLAEHGRAMPQGEAGDALLARFLDHYGANLTARTRPFPGAEDALLALTSAGAALAVVTNKPHALAVPVLEGLGLAGFFEIVFGRDSLPAFKPDPLPLREALARTGRARGVMVGDTITDALAARAAGMPLVLMGFGYGADEVVLAEKEQRLEGFEALFDLVSALGRGETR